MKRYLQIFISTAVLASACAPKVEERRFDPPTTSFGPRSQDIDLSPRLRALESSPVSLTWQGSVPTSVFFQQAENLIALGKLTQKEALKQQGLGWIKNFYQQPQTTSFVDLAQSPFASLAAAQTQNEVQKTLNEVAEDLEKSRSLLKEHIVSLGNAYPWPGRPEDLDKVIDHVQAFTTLVEKNLGNMNLPPMIEEGLRKELAIQTEPLFLELRQMYAELGNSKTLSASLNLVEKAIQKFEVELPPDLKKSLTQGRQIAQGLDSLQDPQGGLTVLIDIWKILNPEEQALYFKPVNADLYDFLSKQDTKELDCLRQEGCSGGIFKGIAKKIFILPKIKKYGLQQLQSEMNEKTRSYVISQIEAFAQSFCAEIPLIFVQKVDEGLIKKVQELSSVQKNYPEYVKRLLAQWGQKVLPESQGHISGFEISNLKVDVSSKSPLALQAVGTLTDLKAPTAGTSMMANTLLLENNSPAESLSLRSALSQINKLISIGGYRDEQNKLIPALLSPVEHEKKPLDLMNLTTSLISYRIPDKIRMQDAFHADENMVYEKNFSASAFADQIKGLSHMLRLTADWKETHFDQILGKIKAQALTEDIQSEALNRPLFPKDMLFALNVGDVAVLLQDITKQATPVFLLTLDNKVLWADQYTQSSETAIMAGIVDIKNGRKSNVVQAQDVAKFLLALSDFLEATEGVENTQSSILLEKDAQGKRPLDALLEGRRDIKLLVLALANFISNQLVTPQSLVQPQYYLKERERSNNPEFLALEQAHGIRALLKAWEITHVEAYLWSAKEIYYSMNKKLYDSKERFYINGDGSKLDFPEKVTTLLALQELKPHLSKESQTQLEKISGPWLRALENLK